MLKFYNNYSHKFINSKKVYSITNNNHHKIFYRDFLSIPYKSDIEKIDTNVLLGFNNESYCKLYIEKINTEFNYNVSLINIEFDDFKYIGKLMNIPIVIILNESYKDKDDAYELFYFFRDKNRKD
jgi:hypothetical protein